MSCSLSHSGTFYCNTAKPYCHKSIKDELPDQFYGIRTTDLGKMALKFHFNCECLASYGKCIVLAEWVLTAFTKYICQHDYCWTFHGPIQNWQQNAVKYYLKMALIKLSSIQHKIIGSYRSEWVSVYWNVEQDCSLTCTIGKTYHNKVLVFSVVYIGLYFFYSSMLINFKDLYHLVLQNGFFSEDINILLKTSMFCHLRKYDKR